MQHWTEIIKKLWYIFILQFNYLKAAEPLREDSLLFSSKFQGVPGVQLIDLGGMNGSVKTYFFNPSHPNAGQREN